LKKLNICTDGAVQVVSKIAVAKKDTLAPHCTSSHYILSLQPLAVPKNTFVTQKCQWLCCKNHKFNQSPILENTIF
jgi:hypothetical protein